MACWLVTGYAVKHTYIYMSEAADGFCHAQFWILPWIFHSLAFSLQSFANLEPEVYLFQIIFIFSQCLRNCWMQPLKEGRLQTGFEAGLKTLISEGILFLLTFIVFNPASNQVCNLPSLRGCIQQLRRHCKKHTGAASDKEKMLALRPYSCSLQFSFVTTLTANKKQTI